MLLLDRQEAISTSIGIGSQVNPVRSIGRNASCPSTTRKGCGKTCALGLVRGVRARRPRPGGAPPPARSGAPAPQHD